MMMKVGFMTVALLMVSIEISAKEISPTLSPSPTMSNDYDYPSSSQLTESSDLNNTENTRTGGGGIVVGAIAAASVVGFGGYLLKKRRHNSRRFRYGYAATEFF